MEKRFCESIAELRLRERIQAPELKGARLLRSNPGRKTLLRIGSLCLGHGVEVSLLGFHKPFMAAAVVVEECTDPQYNNAFDGRWTWDSSLKEPAAERVFQTVSPNVLMDWWRSRRGDNLAWFREVHARLVEELRNVDSTRVFAEGISQVNLGLVHEPPSTRADQPLASFSPNLTAFHRLLQALDAQARSREIESLRIIHDEQVEFEESYRFVVSLLRSAAPAEFRLPNGTITLPIQTVSSIGFRSSDSCIPLQVSDCMASIARHALASLRDRRSSASRQFRPLLRALFEARSGQAFPWVIGPLSWQPGAFAAVSGIDLDE
jgi:hypothetical protein